jgi:uncharacterized membrane protein
MTFAFLKKVDRKWVFWILADIIIFLVFALIAWRYFPAQKQTEYQLDIALRILHGQIPYVNIGSEYPPLALLIFLLPALLFRTLTAYYVAFIIELLLFDFCAMVLIAKTSPRLGISANKALSMHPLAMIAAGPIIAASFDIIPAVLVLAALFFFINGKSNTAWALAGLGILTKLYPVITVPFFVLYQLRQKQYKQIAQGAGILIFIVLALSLPWLLLNAKGFLATYVYHMERGLHAESTYGSILLLGKITGLVQVEGIYNYGSWNLYSTLADQLAGFSIIITAGLLGVVYILYLRSILGEAKNPVEQAGLSQEATTTLIRCVAAAILIFMLSGKVFSMQYMVWLCPLLPLVTGRWRVHFYTAFLAAGVISQIIYPYFYPQFEQFAPVPVAMIFIRNILLVLCAVLLLLPGERRFNKKPETRLESPA